MGIFDWLFGKKETSSDPKKDCCSKKEVEETKKEKKKDNSNDSVLRVHSNDLETIEGISHYKGTPFTGIHYILYPNGHLVFETEQLEGKDHGTCKTYKGDGTIHSVVNFSDGKIHDEDKEKEDEFKKYMRSELTSQMENE